MSFLDESWAAKDLSKPDGGTGGIQLAMAHSLDAVSYIIDYPIIYLFTCSLCGYSDSVLYTIANECAMSIHHLYFSVHVYIQGLQCDSLLGDDNDIYSYIYISDTIHHN